MMEMPIVAKQTGGGDFQIAPEGQYAAVCNKVIDLGTQTVEGQYGVKHTRQVLIGFELHGENQLGDGSAYMNGDTQKPFVVQQKFTLSLGDKSKLRPFLQSWRGKPFTPEELEGFDIANLAWAPCMLTIQHTKSKDGQKTYANIGTITPILKSLQKPAPVNVPVVFELEPWSEDAFNKLSDGLKDLIRKSTEYQEMFGAGSGPVHDDVPPVEAYGDPANPFDA